MWSKPLKGWSEAEQLANGYNAQNILEKVLSSARLVKSGAAIYERDSVIFDKIQHDWPLLAILQKIAIENGNSIVLVDFGGSLGSSYFQNRSWLTNVHIKWVVVEQPHFVEIGKKEFETNELKFEFLLEDAFKYKPHVVLLSSVLQYLENPNEIIAAIASSGVEHIIVDRTSIAQPINQNVVTLQTVPEDLYKASYPCWFFEEEGLKNGFLSNYHLETEFASYCDMPLVQDDITYLWKGYYFKKK